MELWRTLAVPAWLPWTLFVLVAAQRGLELVLSRRNTARLLAQGAREVGRGHYPLLIGLHVLWLVAIVVWMWVHPPVLNVAWTGMYVLLQAARLWTMVSLGPYWTTRIITLPGAPLVRRGPYRFLHHPNYVIVVLEVAALPLAFGAWPVAALFSPFNAIVLGIRVRAENAVLAEHVAGFQVPR
jgi:methyltransferase